MIGRIDFTDRQHGYNGANSLNNVEKEIGKTEKGMSEAELARKKRTGEIECITCESRRYVDGSDDPGVSFKTPTKIEPEQSASKVMSHEMEHYTREAAKAEQEDKEVLSNNIAIFRATCPECGISYVSGGLTTTVTRKRQENEHFYNKSFEENIAVHLGKELDVEA